MKRIIYSMYINIPSDDIERQHSNCEYTKNNTHITTNKLLENYDWLVDRQREYAEKCDADYKVYHHDDLFDQFNKLFNL